jgi:ABC-type polysaccharide/polyol phosphate transport system ATPase subunit
MSSDHHNDLAISVRALGKCYHLYARPQDRLKQTLFRGRRQFYREFWALRNVTFDVPRGHAIGIIGRNGSGKSTLLQIIAQTLAPTEGQVLVRGKLGALLELGSGFNPEFTGRENVYMQGALMGLSPAQVQRLFDQIADYADIGQFIDQPVKTYSSGMFVRLAFAVHVQVRPDILIVDEALSVGDQFFQAKCIATIRNLIATGCTVLMVSHSAATIKSLCSRAILLDHGQLVIHGPCDEVMDRYMSIALSDPQQAATAAAPHSQPNAPSPLAKPSVHTHSLLLPPFVKRLTERFGSGQAKFQDCLLLHNDRETTILQSGQTCRIRAILRTELGCELPGEAGIVVSTIEGIELFAINTLFSNVHLPPLPPNTDFAIDFCFRVPLASGKYRVDLGYRIPVQGPYADKAFNATIFEVVNPGSRIIPFLFDVPASIEIRSLPDLVPLDTAPLPLDAGEDSL